MIRRALRWVRETIDGPRRDIELAKASLEANEQRRMTDREFAIRTLELSKWCTEHQTVVFFCEHRHSDSASVDVIATAMQESLEQLVEISPPHSRATYELVAQDVLDELISRGLVSRSIAPIPTR